MKKKRSNIVWMILCIACFAVFLGWHEYARRADGAVRVWFMAVGQGDGALMQTPNGKYVLIDGGPDTTVLEQFGERLPYFARTVDMLVLSHPHQDHLASFPDILKRYDVKRMLLAKTIYEAPRYEATLALLKEKNVDVLFAEAGQSYEIDGVTMDIFWPTVDVHPTDVNDASIVLRVSYKGRSILFAGDAEEHAEENILTSGRSIRSDILKVGHHGSRTSSSTGFILAVEPSLAVMSVGADNAFGHPSPEILRRFTDLGIPVWRTDEQGTMELVWKD